MPANYVLLAKNVVGAAGASSVTFSSIPQTGYTDLVVKGSARSSGGGANTATYMTFNGSSTGYSLRRLEGDGSAASSDNESTTGRISAYGWVPGVGTTANTFGSGDFYIPNYTSANYKSVSYDVTEENNATQSYSQLGAGLWSNTAAITSITLTAVPTFAQYTTFSLYGVAKSGVTPTVTPYATGGDVVTSDGTYFYHAFKTSGTFTPKKSITATCLIIGGGGGGSATNFGGYGAAGAGGGGGVKTLSSDFAGSTAYTMTVGSGGTGGNNFTQGTNGGSSSVSGGSVTTTTATGGLKTYGYEGGASGADPSNAGGNGYATGGDAAWVYVCGGGGGAGAVGSSGNASTRVAGSGGAGTNTYSTWASATETGASGYYAGGGGGALGRSDPGSATGTAGSGGAGGGGAGGNTNNGTSGTANTGGGGGGGSANPYGAGGGISGNGGSGIVIVRYPI